MSRIALVRAALAAAIVVTSAGCDTPVSHSDHPEAGGLVILDANNGAVIAQVIGRGVHFAAPLNLSVGQTLEVRIKFLDVAAPTDLTRAFFPDEDEGQSLRVDIANAGVLSYADHGDHGDFNALAAGQTTVVFHLYHGSHSDWNTGNLTVNVQ